MPSYYSMEEFKSDCNRFNTIAGKDNNLDKEDIRKQLDLIKEELNETYKALDENDYVGVLDGYCDILVTTFGFGQQLENLGMQTKQACRDTAENNLSKFIWVGKSRSEACEAGQLVNKSLDKLLDQGVTASATYSVLDNCYVIKDKQNKIRKPANFISNNLSQYVPDNLKALACTI